MSLTTVMIKHNMATGVQEFPFDLYVGTSTGLLKGCRLDKNKAFNINVFDASTGKPGEISCLDWRGDKAWCLLAGRRDGVLSFNPPAGTSARLPIQVPDGLPAIRRVQGDGQLTITAWSNGSVSGYRLDFPSDSDVPGSDEPVPDPVLQVKAGAHLSHMDYSSASHLLATGGRENPLKIWDVTSPHQPVFCAKNVRNDWLNLRVPVWVTRTEFLPGTNKVMTSTGYSQIRLYDPSSPQRRPVIEIQLDDKGHKYPITALAGRSDSQLQVVVGTTVGTLALADLRKKAIVKQYKAGTGGGIVDLKCHPSSPTFASGGIDGYIHWFDLNTSKKVHSMYLHSPINCLLFPPEVPLSGDNNCVLCEDVSKSVHAETENDEEEDDVWDQLEVVQTKNMKSGVDRPNKNKKIIKSAADRPNKKRKRK
ncbi:hypothetical protein BsWGS_00013 [Bradybaena similaris]